jgi:hypothetical protein
MHKVNDEVGQLAAAVLKIFEIQHSDLTSKNETKPVSLLAELEMSKMTKFSFAGASLGESVIPGGATGISGGRSLT